MHSPHLLLVILDPILCVHVAMQAKKAELLRRKTYGGAGAAGGREAEQAEAKEPKKEK